MFIVHYSVYFITDPRPLAYFLHQLFREPVSSRCNIVEKWLINSWHDSKHCGTAIRNSSSRWLIPLNDPCDSEHMDDSSIYFCRPIGTDSSKLLFEDLSRTRGINKIPCSCCNAVRE